MQHTAIYCQIVGGMWGLFFVFKFFFVVLIRICMKARWERYVQQVMLCLPQFNSSIDYYIIPYFSNMPEIFYLQNVAKTYCKAHLCQGPMQLVAPCSREWQGPLGGCQARPHQTRLVPPSQTDSRMGSTGRSWGQHICPRFMFRISRTHGRAQVTKLSSVHSLVEHGQFCNSYLPNASPQLSTVNIAVLHCPGPFISCCAFAYTFLN